MLKYGEKRIPYLRLLATRSNPIVGEEKVGEWFARQTATRRRKLIWLHKKQEGRCFYCDEPTILPENMDSGLTKQQLKYDGATLDHLIPQVDGGTDSLKNLVCSCAYCNSRRGTMAVDRFVKLAKRWKEEGTTRGSRDAIRHAKKLEDKLADPKKQLASWHFLFALTFLLYDAEYAEVARKLVDK